MDFGKVVREFSERLSQAGIRHGLAGAMALHGLGLTRATQDVDFIVDDPGRETALGIADALGYERLGVYEGFSNHLHPDTAWGRVDLLFLEGTTADLLFGKGRRVTIFGVDMLVPKPEHVIAMKVQAMKDNPKRALKEMFDIGDLIRLPGIDFDEVRGYFRSNGLEHKFEEIRALFRRD